LNSPHALSIAAYRLNDLFRSCFGQWHITRTSSAMS